MQNVIDKVQQTDWQRISNELNDKGYAHVPSFLTKSQCAELISSYEDSNGYRKTVVMERYRFGLG